MKRRVDEAGRAARCVTAQRLLAERGFPSPMPLTDVIVSDGVAVHAERLVPGGELETRDTPEVAAKSGRLLADLVRRLATLDLRIPRCQIRSGCDGTRRPSGRRPWPCPAGSRTPSGACRRSWPAATCQLVLGHADWEAQNIRWQNGEAHVVHDWDSLAWLPEAAIAGSAAGIFASHGATTLAPLESSEAFLRAYEDERGALFSLSETGDRLGGEHLGSAPQRSQRTDLQPAEAQLRTTESGAS